MITGIEIYHLLAGRKLTSSLRDCSYLLGKNPSYLAQCGDRPLSLSALTHLFRYLMHQHRYTLATKVGRAILWGTNPTEAEES